MARVVFGAPLHNGERHLPEAVESLLGQTAAGFSLVLVDDASTDGTESLARGYADSDPRVRYERSATRLGLIGTWRRALELARAGGHDAEYFAWASDHDVWDARWLESMLEALDGHPEAVLAYPLSVRIGEHGEDARPNPPWRFDTAGVRDPRERFARFARDGVAGDMVYGLFRLAALERVGFPSALVPDRLLLARLSLAGEFRQVPHVLWRRRYVRRVSGGRQRAYLFPAHAPLSTRVPWPLAHAVWLARSGASEVGRWTALRLASSYLAASSWRQLRKQLLRPVAAASRVRRSRLGAPNGRPVGGGCHPVARLDPEPERSRLRPWKR